MGVSTCFFNQEEEMDSVNGNVFTSKRLTRSAEICLRGALDRVFPLFGALREQEWAAGWDPQVLFSESGEIEERMVFRTSSAHGHAEGPYTWIVSKYLPEGRQVEYTVFTTERVWWIEICCREGKASGETLARVTYTYNGLSEHGNRLNAMAAERMFAEDLHDWERAINHYLETGELLTH